MTRVALSPIAATYVTIDVSESPALVLARADIASDALLVITAVDEENIRRPVGVVDQRSLAAIAKDATPLGDIVMSLPPLVTMAVDGDSVEAEALLAIADTLSRYRAVPGVVLEREDEILTAITRNDIATVLPLDLLSDDQPRGETQPGNLGKRYSCAKCTPPSFHIPKPSDQGSPACRRVWFHGSMEPAT